MEPVKGWHYAAEDWSAWAATAMRPAFLFGPPDEPWYTAMVNRTLSDLERHLRLRAEFKAWLAERGLDD